MLWKKPFKFRWVYEMGSFCSLGWVHICVVLVTWNGSFSRKQCDFVCLSEKKERERERTKNKTKRSPRSLHKCMLSCSAVSHSLQHKVCSHAKDACTFLRSRRTVKAVSAGYDIYPAPALCTAQPACPSQRLTPQSLSWKHPRNILDLQCELKCLLYTRLRHGV